MMIKMIVYKLTRNLTICAKFKILVFSIFSKILNNLGTMNFKKCTLLAHKIVSKLIEKLVIAKFKTSKLTVEAFKTPNLTTGLLLPF